MRFLSFALALLISALINIISQAQCESEIGRSAVVRLGGLGTQVTSSMDIGGFQFDYNAIFVGQAEGPSHVTFNGLPTKQSYQPGTGDYL